jgi:hypothetical protein
MPKQPFLNQSIPQKIVPDFSILSWIRLSGFHFFEFHNSNSFTENGHQSCVHPEDKVCVFMSPSDRVAQLHPQALGSLFVPFYDSQS